VIPLTLISPAKGERLIPLATSLNESGTSLEKGNPVSLLAQESDYFVVVTNGFLSSWQRICITWRPV